jgi:AcrR family transcriptional regulator/DNA-binding MarR family transcriptional regulator
MAGTSGRLEDGSGRRREDRGGSSGLAPPERNGARRARGNGAERGGVVEIQRARMIAAMAQVAREGGIGGVTVAHVVARSGVSRRTFYELFEDREDCFRAAFDLAVGRAAGRVVPAYRAAASWPEQMRAGVGALLEFLEDEPDLGTLCVVDALGAGPRALEDRAAIVEILVDAVHAGSLRAKGSLRPTRLTAEGVVGAVLAVLHARLALSEAPSSRKSGAPPVVTSLVGPLVGMIVLPYLGAAAAAREVSRPAPAHRRVSRSVGDPLRDLDMRLTYRTVRVLLAIAANPGASNRQVADVSGVSDQGQISKLLSRLEHLGLIGNESVGASRGEPNIWSLTSKGEQIERVVRPQAAPSGD